VGVAERSRAEQAERRPREGPVVSGGDCTTHGSISGLRISSRFGSLALSFGPFVILGGAISRA
jgi:hypothetical protein